MSKVNHNPISVTALWESTWVFTLYGLGVSVTIAVMSTLGRDLTDIEKVMMEPVAIYAFSILSIIGLLSLGIINITSAKTAKEMKEHRVANAFWLPIANSGLSTGAIILGMMIGISIGMWVYSFVDPEALKISKVMFALAIFVLALLYPLVLMKRSMFDEYAREKRASVAAGVIYCLTVLSIIWVVDESIFIEFVMSFVFISCVTGLFIQFKLRKNG